MTSDQIAENAKCSVTMLERCARAIYDAEDPLSGDPIAVLIHMSDHLFWDDRLPGETDIERQREAIRIVCRAAAKAVLEVLREPDEGMVAEVMVNTSNPTQGQREIAAKANAIYGDITPLGMTVAADLVRDWQNMIDAASK